MSENNLSDLFAERMGTALGPDFPDRVGLAVSGGGDSMAMLALAHGWARVMGVGLRVATVDHGLRAESAAEAAMVARECAALGHPHDTLVWRWDGRGNLQDAARRGRIACLDAWRGDLDHVLFAHTMDDVAETLLMRLERGSGVDGLSAMPLKRRASGFWQVRPLLDARRADLRHYAKTLKVPFVDDPSNEDERFARARVRKTIDDLGLDVQGLAATGARLARARDALDARMVEVARCIAREVLANGLPTGIASLDRDGLATIERETQLRLLARLIGWVSGSRYKPRAAALEEALDRALGGAGSTLQGVQIAVMGDAIHLLRELRAVGRGVRADENGLWDGRWKITSSDSGHCVVRALGEEGWRQIAKVAAPALPHALALSLPALFEGDRLLACAQLGYGPPVAITLSPDLDSFLLNANLH